MFVLSGLKCRCIVFLSFLCQNGRQQISIPISLPPAPGESMHVSIGTSTSSKLYSLIYALLATLTEEYELF